MNSSHRSVRACVGMLAALSLVTAACAGSSEGGSDTGTDEAAPTTEAADTEAPDTAAPVTAAPDTEPVDEPDTSEAPDGEETPDEPDEPAVELTASARGVTADTITIGYSYLDFDELVDLGLTSQGWGDQEAQFQSVVDDINDNGGILGRSIEVIYEPYSALSTAVAEEACLRLTQDHEVFAVLGGFVGPSEPANTCIVGRGETILVGGVQSEERLGEATAPWVTDRPLRTRQADVLVSLLQSEGELEGRNIVVVASIDAEDVRDDVADVLRAAGSEPVDVLQSDAPVGEFVAEDASWATLAERIRGTDADTVLLVGNPSAGIRNVASQGLDLDILVLDQESLTSLGTSVDLEDARGAMAAAPLVGQELWDDESMADCIDAFTAAQPDTEIIEPADLVEGDDDISRGLSFGCRFMKMFELIANGAGADLTQESFAEALSGMSQFSIPGQPFASFSDTKFDSNDSFALVAFNPEIGADGGFDNLTEIKDVTP